MSTQPFAGGANGSTAARLDTDVQILERMLQGDEQAVVILYDRYSQLAYSILLRVLRDEGTAEELTQDIFLQLWQNPGAYDSSRGTLRTWIAVVCRHRAVDQLRKRRWEVDLDDIDLPVTATQEDSASQKQFREKIHAQLRGMPDAERLVLELAYFEGYTHSEISSKTGLPLGTIKSRIRSALAKLRNSRLERSA